MNSKLKQNYIKHFLVLSFYLFELCDGATLSAMLFSCDLALACPIIFIHS